MAAELQPGGPHEMTSHLVWTGKILFIASGEEGFLASLVFNVAMFLDADTYGPTKCKESADPA